MEDSLKKILQHIIDDGLEGHIVMDDVEEEDIMEMLIHAYELGRIHGIVSKIDPNSPMTSNVDLAFTSYNQIK